MKDNSEEFVRVPRWYFGGLAAAGAACCTHPLDLIKVQMQTHKAGRISIMNVTKLVYRKSGILGFYSGISASLLRQLSYSTVRFAFYETEKQQLMPADGSAIPFWQSIIIAGIGGFFGGIAGNPADLVNVRMQNDVKLPIAKRRHYKNAVHAIYKVATQEGIATLWLGVPLNAARSALMTIGQVSCYDKIKILLLETRYFQDNIIAHTTASLAAGFVATSLTQPVDVIKTRIMNTKLGDNRSITGKIKLTAKEGPLAFFKGFIPAFVRLAPHCVFTFVFYEQLRIHFGKLRRNVKKK